MKSGFIVACVLLSLTGLLGASESMHKADSLFQLRNKDFDTGRLIANTANVSQAIAVYKTILESNCLADEQEQAFWKLMQAYYFKGQFGSHDKNVKKAIYSEGIETGEKYIGRFNDSVECTCWLGIIWARWAEVYGTLAAARKGVAKKVKYYGEKTVALDDRYLDAGGYRLLGMLHFSVPKIPIFLTWPSKDLAFEYLEKAYSLAPNNLYNKMYLAEVLYSQSKKQSAKTLLLEIVNTNSIVHDLAIDSYIKAQAKTFLKEHY